MGVLVAGWMEADLELGDLDWLDDRATSCDA